MQYQLLPELEPDEYAALKASIAQNGVLVPVEFDENGAILDGHHRVRAVEELRAAGVAIPDYPRLVRAGLTEEQKYDHALVLNLARRHLSGEQRRELHVKLRQMGKSYREIAERTGVDPATVMRDTRSSTVANATVQPDRIIGRDGKSRPAVMPRREEEEEPLFILKPGARGIQDAVLNEPDEEEPAAPIPPASVFATNAREQARAIQTLQQAPAGIVPPGATMPAGEVITAGRTAARAEQIRQQAEAISQEPPPLPSGPFRVIAIDPPWEYDKRPEDPTHRARLQYPSMTIEEIKALPIPEIACEDCILWLWTTNAHMPLAFEALAAWGFQHKTILTWEKDRMGTGDWLRGRTEHCILAVRGRPVVTLTNQTTILHGSLREHSRKPEEFYALVEALCPGSRVELFSRTQRPGWASHGDQADHFSA